MHRQVAAAVADTARQAEHHRAQARMRQENLTVWDMSAGTFVGSPDRIQASVGVPSEEEEQ